MSTSKRILQIHPLFLNIIKIWSSATEAANILGICRTSIIDTCSGKYSVSNGYFWRYFDEYIKSINTQQHYQCYQLSNNNLFNNKFQCNPFLVTNNMNGYIQPCFIFNNNEIWKDVIGYYGLYQVSNFGRVISLYNKPYIYLLNPSFDKDGYRLIALYKESIQKMYTIHRLVAETFIPNPNNLPCINHKDEIKINNFVENLEWCSYEYNDNYGTRNEKISKSNSKPVQQINKITNEIINEFDSIKEANKYTGIDHNISVTCSGKRNQAGGYGWKYK